MKGTERHKLKENELSHVLSEAATRLAENRAKFGPIVALVLVVALGAGGYWAWNTRNETRAQLLLSDALAVIQSPVEEPKPVNGKVTQAPGTYPTVSARAEAALVKFAAVHDAYPSTTSGIAARYYAASALAMLGRSGEAATRFQEVVDRAGTNVFYGRMAQLGRIEAQLQAKQFDQAIGAAQALANNADETLPRDAVLMELGRVYAAAGKKTEAKQTFDKVVAEFPESPYADEAKQLLTTLT
ncbi:MAG: tetratricopeptide repeat protein [Vicinamibacterales bacterium]|nr:tetratricopeptide repeat protein [Vicinamibacterales bacterium]